MQNDQDIQYETCRKRRAATLPSLLSFAIASTPGSSGSRQESHWIDAGARADDQIYTAVLKPLNPRGPAPRAAGLATIHVTGQTFSVTLIAWGLAPRVTQLQFIQAADRCPAPDQHDTNRDQWLDAEETSAVSGALLIPLDDDLSRQREEMTSYPSPLPYEQLGMFPRTDRRGALHYDASSPLSPMLADLRSPNRDPDAWPFARLDPSGTLELSRRTLVIYGVPGSTLLPTTVQPILRAAPWTTLPVACGEIREGRQARAESPQPHEGPEKAHFEKKTGKGLKAQTETPKRGM